MDRRPKQKALLFYHFVPSINFQGFNEVVWDYAFHNKTHKVKNLRSVQKSFVLNSKWENSKRIKQKATKRYHRRFHREVLNWGAPNHIWNWGANWFTSRITVLGLYKAQDLHSHRLSGLKKNLHSIVFWKEIIKN